MLIENELSMEQRIIKKDGNVYLETIHDVYGKHRTFSFMGKEFVEVNNDENPKQKKGRIKKDTD